MRVKWSHAGPRVSAQALRKTAFTVLQPEGGNGLQAQHRERKDRSPGAPPEGVEWCGGSGCQLDRPDWSAGERGRIEAQV